MMEAVENLLPLLSLKQKASILFKSVDADEMRLWSNPIGALPNV
jgi:hypothetical protein